VAHAYDLNIPFRSTTQISDWEYYLQKSHVVASLRGHAREANKRGPRTA